MKKHKLLECLNPKLIEIVQNYILHLDDVVGYDYRELRKKYIARRKENIPELAGDITTTITSMYFPEKNRSIQVYIHVPEMLKNSLPIIYLHGGGNVFGTAASYAEICKRLAFYSGAVVIDIDFSLSPEVHYPVNLEEIIFVINNLVVLLTEQNLTTVKSNQILLIGDSSGGCLAASIAASNSLLLKNITIVQQILLYPYLDYTFSQLSQLTFNGYMVNQRLAIYLFTLYFGSFEQETWRKASPFFMTELPDNYPETIIVLPDLDPAYDECKLFFQQLQNQEIKSELVLCPGMVHSFLALEKYIHNECHQFYKQIAQKLIVGNY